MRVVYERCCGLDVHKETVAACVLLTGADGRVDKRVRTFSTMTADLLALADWLGGLGVTHVAMESTGIYWRPIFNLLEDGRTVLLVNAQHVKAVPGRKTDVKDSEWLADLLRHGLLQPSFIPPAPVRALRDLTRYRKTLVQERAQEVNRLHKVLETANLKLASVATDILGASGRRMLEAILAGEHDPAVLAELARGRLRQKLPQLGLALQGRLEPHHLVLIERILAHVDFVEESLAALQAAIADDLVPFATSVALLQTIPGISEQAAATIIAEIGTGCPLGVDAVPLGQAPGFVGGALSGQPRERGQAPQQQGETGRPLAERRPGGGGLGRGADPRHLPQRPIPPHRTPPRRLQGDRGRGAQRLGHRLPRPAHRPTLRRPRARLLRPP
jgi:transposase